MIMWWVAENFVSEKGILMKKVKTSSFNPKQISFVLFFFSIPFLIVGIENLKKYEYFIYEQLKYANLHSVEGEIIFDDRPPPDRYNDRLDGIYIKTKDKNINIYCDNVDKPLVSYGSRSGGGLYAPGRCDWIAVKRQREGRCESDSNKIFCENPRSLYGYKIYAKVDENMTVYELKLNNVMFYSYDEMVMTYKDKYIGNLKSDLSFGFGFFITSLLFFIISRKEKYKKLRILSSK